MCVCELFGFFFCLFTLFVYANVHALFLFLFLGFSLIQLIYLAMRGRFNELLMRTQLQMNRPRLHLKFVPLLNSFILCLLLFLFHFHIWHIHRYIYILLYIYILKFLLDFYIKISLSNSKDKTSQSFSVLVLQTIENIDGLIIFPIHRFFRLILCITPVCVWVC